MTEWLGHLKLKVLAFGIAMSVLPLSIFGWYSLQASAASQVAIVQGQNLAVATTVAEELAQFVGGITGHLQLSARMVGADLLHMERDGQERVLYTLLRNVPYLEEVALAGADGMELLRVSRREVTVGLSGQDYAARAWWQEVGRGRPAMGEVLLEADGRPYFQVGVPLPDGDGALIARASLRGVVNSIAALRGSGSARALVLDQAGRLIGAGDFSLVLASAPVPFPDGNAPYRSVSGEEALGLVTPVPGLLWQVIGETTLTDAMAPVRQLTVEYAVGALILMGLILSLSVVFGLQLTEPLERLEAGANRVGAGDFSFRIPAGGRDELGRLVIAFNGMTKRLQAQDASLRAERDRLDTVVSAIGAGLALIDGHGTVLWANRTLSTWFGGALIGKPCWEALGRPDCAGSACCAKRPAVERQVQIGGKPLLLRYSTYLVGGGAPGEPARLEVLEDITEHRAMEAMVLQSEKLAAVGQLAAGVAHEINNPLAVISAYAEDLADRLKEEGALNLDASGDLEAYLTQLQVQVQRCKGITGNLLSFARQGPAEPEPVDLAEVCQQTADLVGPRARRARVQILLALPEGLPRVRVARDHLQQIYLNLLTNALDALEETGPGEIQITAALQGGMIRITVADTGPGMDAITLERALEPFFTTKPPGKGTGLGLSMCYGIITGSGGRMWLQSSPGAGTAVHCELPVWQSTGKGGES